MVTPLIPLLLATVLGAGPMALGFIEGLADTTTNLLKLWAGRRSDMARRRRKPFVLFGYTLSNLVRPLIGFSGSWLMVVPYFESCILLINSASTNPQELPTPADVTNPFSTSIT